MWREEGQGLFANTRTSELASRTPEQPGIYEFAISRTRTSNTKHTVYVGMSKNLRTRHMQYARNGSHIREFFEAALRQGNVVWRRLITLSSELQAQQEEMLCQTVLDYPWNKDQNPNATRIVYTTKTGGLLSKKVLVVIEQRTGQRRVYDV
jgi:hypothetical protein